MKVLIAIDGTECSWMTIDYVLHQAWHKSDEFKVLTVVEPMPTEFDVAEYESLDDYASNMLASCNAITNKALQKLRAKFPHNQLSSEISYGTVADRIVEYGREWGADLIVMGTHGRRDCRRFLQRSVAETVLKHAPCAVEIVKMKKEVESAANSNCLDYSI